MSQIKMVFELGKNMVVRMYPANAADESDRLTYNNYWAPVARVAEQEQVETHSLAVMTAVAQQLSLVDIGLLYLL